MPSSKSFNPPLVGNRTIEDFKARLSGGAARPNLFEVELAFPSYVQVPTESVANSRFLIKAAQLQPRILTSSTFLSEEEILRLQVTEHLMSGLLQSSMTLHSIYEMHSSNG